MIELTNRDMKDVLTAVRVALDCGQIDELREEILNCLEKVFKCERSVSLLALHTYDQLNFHDFVIHGLDDSLMEQYADYYYRFDPIMCRLPLIEDCVVTVDEFMPFRKLVKTAYYNGFNRPQSIHYEMVLFLRAGNRLLGSLSFLRPRNTRNFTIAEKAKAQILSSYLAKVLQEKMLLDYMKQRNKLYDNGVTDSFQPGTVFFNESLEPIHMDENAGRILDLFTDKEDPQGLTNPSLPEKFYCECEKFINATLTKDIHEPCEHRFSVFDNESDKKLSALVSLVFHQNKKPTLKAFLGIEDPFAPVRRRLSEVGLTRREREVVCLVCKGMQNNEISDRLFISRFTVEAHLKSIYDKMAVNNRTSLIHRVMTLM